MGPIASRITVFGHRSKETSKLRVTGLYERNPSVTSGFPQSANNAENVSIWLRHYECFLPSFFGHIYDTLSR